MKRIFSVAVLVAFLSIDLACCDESGEKSEKQSQSSIEKVFKDHQLVPDVVSAAPQRVLKVNYKAAHKEVDLGNELEPKHVKEEPEVHFEADPKAFYTLTMADPDAPSRSAPVMRQWSHWLVVNIPGSDVSKGNTLTEYVGAAPPHATGLHRYVILLFKQPGKLEFDEPHRTKVDGSRGQFDLGKFTHKYKLGHPIAGNFFEAKYDDSVPATHKQLTGKKI